MATLGKAYLHASATHPQRVGRFPISHAFGQPITTHANAVTPTTRGGAYGVIGEDDFKVTITTGLGWSCAAGRIIATGTSALAQGAYAGLNDAAVTGTLSARDATNPRITLICYRVRDTDEDATTFEDDGIVMIDGTPAASPADPTLTASLGSLVVLSRVTLPSTASGAAPTYSDVRRYAAALGGVQRVTSTTLPTGAALMPGIAYERDTARYRAYNGSTWEMIDIGQVMKTGSHSATVGASGDLAITFGLTFASAPQLFLTTGDNLNHYPTVLFGSVTTTGGTAIMHDGNAGAALPNGTLSRVNWLAVGRV